MKVIAAVDVDLQDSPLGTRSRLADELAGVPVLRRTVQRLRQCDALAGIFLLTRPEQRADAEALVAGLDATVVSADAPTPPWQELVVSSRKWALGSWRGGLGSTCAFDESLPAAALAQLGQREGADGVLSIPAAAAVIAPDLLAGLISQFEQAADTYRMVFTQAPPGLAGAIFRPDLLGELAEAGLPAGISLGYRPDRPAGDPVTKSCCFQAPTTVVNARGRLMADTQRGFDHLAELLAAGDPPSSAEAIARWLLEQEPDIRSLPREVEIELTTDDPLTETTLRPRGRDVGRRGPIDLQLLDHLFAELTRDDDSVLVVLGGFGDPLRHSDLPRVLQLARRHGVFGLAVATHLIDLSPSIIETLIESRVDVLAVHIDAHSRETYQRVHNRDAFEQVLANVEQVLRVRAERKSVWPLVVPQMVKAASTIGDMEAFYDHWLRRLGWASIIGYSDRAGQRPNLAVADMAPPKRTACRRLGTRWMILADGRVVACDQDYAARSELGNLHHQSWQQIISGQRFQRLQQAHAGLSLQDFPLCAACHEWHRP